MKNTDELERFMRDHREDFNSDLPPDKIWDQIERRLRSVGQESSRERGINKLPLPRLGKRWISAAAVLLLCISLAAFVRTYQVRQQITDTVIPSGLQQVQAYYENRIAMQIDRIKSFESMHQNKADTSLWQLFGRRDEEYNRIRRALQENPGNAHVRAAFVEYYRSRLSILDQIEQRMETTDASGKAVSSEQRQ